MSINHPLVTPGIYIIYIYIYMCVCVYGSMGFKNKNMFQPATPPRLVVSTHERKICIHGTGFNQIPSKG